MTVHIAILVEGATEMAFKRVLVDFLSSRLSGKMPKLDFAPARGRIPKEERLQRVVRNLLDSNDAVIALTDVYTGTNPPDFNDAADAKNKMRTWVGSESRFYPHAAQYEFEAWLLPYWPSVQKLAGSDHQCPSPHPETVDHDKPPAKLLAEIFKKRRYSKPRDATAILRGQDLAVSAARCPELKAFLNTILSLSGGQTL